MRLFRPRKKSTAENVLPLINVVFLLLVFFMLAGVLEKGERLDITPPETLNAAQPNDTTVVLLVGADGRISFQDEIFQRTDVVGRLKAYFADNPDGRLKLKADAQSDAAMVLALIEELRAVGLKELDLLAIGAS